MKHALSTSAKLLRSSRETSTTKPRRTSTLKHRARTSTLKPRAKTSTLKPRAKTSTLKPGNFYAQAPGKNFYAQVPAKNFYAEAPGKNFYAQAGKLLQPSPEKLLRSSPEPKLLRSSPGQKLLHSSRETSKLGNFPGTFPGASGCGICNISWRVGQESMKSKLSRGTSFKNRENARDRLRKCKSHRKTQGSAHNRAFSIVHPSTFLENPSQMQREQRF